MCAFAVFLTACSQKEVTPPPVFTHQPLAEIKVDPKWPKAIRACKVDSLKLENGMAIGEEGVVVTIPYKDSLDFRVCQEDKLRYIKDLTSMVCTYRAHLNEDRCKPFIQRIEAERKSIK